MYLYSILPSIIFAVFLLFYTTYKLTVIRPNPVCLILSSNVICSVSLLIYMSFSKNPLKSIIKAKKRYQQISRYLL